MGQTRSELEASKVGRIQKGVKCSVSGCKGEAVRSLSAAKVKTAGLKVGNEKRAYLCKEHYKEYKKKTKKDKQLEKWRYSA
jgi:hypothetical protein